MYQPQLARCPYCQQPTLVNGYFCAFCGRQLAQFPPQQHAPQPGYGQAPPPQQYRGTPQQGAPQTSRPPLVCAYCGVANDPWLNHCKVCQRPLASTQ